MAYPSSVSDSVEVAAFDAWLAQWKLTTLLPSSAPAVVGEILKGLWLPDEQERILRSMAEFFSETAGIPPREFGESQRNLLERARGLRGKEATRLLEHLGRSHAFDSSSHAFWTAVIAALERADRRCR